MSAERYPLWCVDRGEDYGEHRYSGPYGGRIEAALWQAEHGGKVRRCRRVKASEIDGVINFDKLVGDADQRAYMGRGPQTAWLAEDDEIVTVTEGGHDALMAWADKHLVVEAFVCEGDE